MKKGLKLKNAIIAAIDMLIALYLFFELYSLMQDINVIRVPYRLFAFLSYFGFGIILSVISLLGSIRLIKISARLIGITTIFSVIISLFGGLFIISIIPYE